MKMRCLVLVACILCVSGEVRAQTQPYGVILDPNGISRVLPPFDSEGWSLTRGSGDSTHRGDDYHAQDWAVNCFSEGQRLYAGISGSLTLNPTGDGSQESYGNTAIVTDYQSGFAQRFAHLQQFASGLKSGDLVLAGQFIGLVGATGNVFASSSCAQAGGRGAHAHIVLYKNVPSFTGRPTASTETNGGPTRYAAQFTYATHVPLIKSRSDPAVFAFVDAARIPVTAFVFANQGWNFDRYRIMFDPLSGNIHEQSTINGLPQAGWLFEPRSGSLIRGYNDPTVYLIQDGRKKGLPYHVFVCRGLGFEDVSFLPDHEVGTLLPHGSVPAATGCRDEVRQALADFVSIVAMDRRFQTVQLGTYGANLDWDQSWELRWVDMHFTGYRQTRVYHATSKSDSSSRMMLFWDLDQNSWSGWHRMY